MHTHVIPSRHPGGQFEASLRVGIFWRWQATLAPKSSDIFMLARPGSERTRRRILLPQRLIGSQDSICLLFA